MKQYFKFFSFCLMVTFGFTSCDTTDEESMDDRHRDLGGYAHLVNTRISQFDTDSDLTIDLFTANGVSVETVEIIQDGSTIGTATVGEETATFNSSILGDIETGNTFPIRIRATLSNGNIAEQPFTVRVVNSLSVSSNNPEEAALSELPDAEVSFSTFTIGAPIDNVEMHLRRGSQGTYTDSGVSDFECTAAGQCTVTIGETNYESLNLAVNDTLYYRFTAASEELSQSAEDYIVIVEEPEEDDE